jgi:hypothetical protein
VTKVTTVSVNRVCNTDLFNICMWLAIIDLKRITRCKLASIFTSADYRKFLGLFGAMFGSEAARL